MNEIKVEIYCANCEDGKMVRLHHGEGEMFKEDVEGWTFGDTADGDNLAFCPKCKDAAKHRTCSTLLRGSYDV